MRWYTYYMKPLSRKFEIAIIIVAGLVLLGVWALNGYDDTWLYITAAIIAIPTSLFYVSKKDKDR